MGGSIDGYLGGEHYPSGFHRQFTPAWIDAMLRHHGAAPPRRQDRDPFALLDLGCGDGMGLVALAAAYPEGRFLGVDALAEHVARGSAAAARVGLTNVAFRCARFAEFADPIDPDYDYVTAQGVLSWVSPDNRAHLNRLAAAHLKPGGVACFGYNAMPGWIGGMAVQHMLNILALDQRGDAEARYGAALAQVDAIAVAAPHAFDSAFLAWLEESRATLPARYFPHEYLNSHWQPLWSDDVQAAMSAVGLVFAGTARVELLRRDFILRAAQRTALARIEGATAREAATDMMLGTSFRIDLFGKELGSPGDCHDARMAGWWAATEREPSFEHATSAALLRFDNAAVKAVIAALRDRPRPVAAMAPDGWDGTGADLLEAIDVLWLSGQVQPCDPPTECPAAGAFNRLIAAEARAGPTLPALAGRYGAMSAAHSMIVAAGAGDASATAMLDRIGIARLVD